MDRFTIPRDLYYGRGALSRLKQLNGSRAMLVCGAAARQSGFLRRAEGFLQEAGMLVRPFVCTPGGPTLALALTGAKAMQEFKPGWIVALGGEESISAAKAMWAFYEDPGLTPRAFLEEGRLPLLRRGAGKPPWAARRFCWTPPRAAGICCGIRSWRRIWPS